MVFIRSLVIYSRFISMTVSPLCAIKNRNICTRCESRMCLRNFLANDRCIRWFLNSKYIVRISRVGGNWIAAISLIKGYSYYSDIALPLDVDFNAHAFAYRAFSREYNREISGNIGNSITSHLARCFIDLLLAIYNSFSKHSWVSV